MSSIQHSQISSIRMDTLTIELRVLILSHSVNLSSFKALILSCSAFHQAYLSAPKIVLLALAHGKFGNDGIPLQLPYMASIQASRVDGNAPEYVERVSRFLDDSSEVENTFGNDISADDCIQLLRLHRDATIISEDVYIQSRSRHPLVDTEPQPLDGVTMSLAERRRITKAIYRWELWRKLLAAPRSTSPANKQLSKENALPKLRVEDQVSLFLARYPFWEQEQLACLCDYAMRRYMALFDEVAPSINGDSVAQVYASSTIREEEPDEVEDEDGGKDPFIDRLTLIANAAYGGRTQRRDIVVSRGPSILARILRSANNRPLFLELITCSIRRPDVSATNFSDLMPRSYAREAARPAHKATPGRHLVGEEWEKGEEEKEAKERQSPQPYGWLWAREEVISPGPFPWFSHEYLVPWGYVFWDEWRFREWGFEITRIAEDGGGMGNYKYFDEDPGVDDSVGFGICERDTGEPLDQVTGERGYSALFEETAWIPFDW